MPPPFASSVIADADMRLASYVTHHDKYDSRSQVIVNIQATM